MEAEKAQAQAEAEVVEVGYFGAGSYVPTDKLEAGEVGYVAASIKNVSDINVGQTEIVNITLPSDATDDVLIYENGKFLI